MREILFKAKRVNWESLPKEEWWVEGYYYKTYGCRNGIKSDAHFIHNYEDDEDYKIDPETICQYTGLTDKNGRKIFEGYIVKFKHGGEFIKKGIYFRNYAVEFINTFVTYGLRLRNKSIHFPFKQATVSMHDVEVIGNIFDNPELLENREAAE